MTVSTAMFTFLEIRRQAEESKEEAKRIIAEKGLGLIDSLIFLFRTSFNAKKCAEDYVDAVLAGGSNIFCKCGCHPSRRRNKEILKETIMEDLRKISRKFPVPGSGDEISHAAMLLLMMLDTLRERLPNQQLVKEFYVGMGNEGIEVLPKSVYEIARRLCDGEINIGQADAELILLKGDYQTLMENFGIEPSEDMDFFVIRIS